RCSSGECLKVKATLQWVSAAHAHPAAVRLYDHIFTTRNPGEAEDFTAVLNPNSLETLTLCQVEPSLVGAAPGSRYQFERQGYFCVDAEASAGRLVFNRTVSLKDEWAKIERGQQQEE